LITYQVYYMQCRKRLQINKDVRCKHNATIEGYCQEHWQLYQLGVEFHDPSQDYDYEDPELNDLIQTLEREDFFEISVMNSRTRVDTDEMHWDQALTDLTILGDNHFAEIARSVNQLIPKGEISRTDLEKFSKDKQNVHTSVLVKKTTEIANNLIKLAREIDEPVTHDTLVCILKACKLSGKAQDNMLEYYFMENSIYELPSPTFKLTLDGLWIYIQKQSSEMKNNLIERLSQELEDNTGTCAQGNLSRLVNTLNGFTHTIEQDVPLGDLMKNLMEESDLRIRKKKALNILNERKVSKEDSQAWLDLIGLV